MRKERVAEIKERLEGLDQKPLHFADDYAMELGQTGREALELVEEVERLGALEARMEADLARNYQMMDTLLADYRVALDADREMAANQISEHRGRLAVENKVLEKMLRG